MDKPHLSNFKCKVCAIKNYDPWILVIVRMDDLENYLIGQFLLVIPVNATYLTMHWFAAVNAMMLPLYCIVVPLFGRRFWWNAT